MLAGGAWGWLSGTQVPLTHVSQLWAGVLGAPRLLPARFQPGLGGLALCCAVVDMETLQLSVCRVPSSQWESSFPFGGGERQVLGAGSINLELSGALSTTGHRVKGHRTTSFQSSEHGVSPTNRVPTWVTQELGIQLAPNTWAPHSTHRLPRPSPKATYPLLGSCWEMMHED